MASAHTVCAMEREAVNNKIAMEDLDVNDKVLRKTMANPEIKLTAVKIY